MKKQIVISIVLLAAIVLLVLSGCGDLPTATIDPPTPTVVSPLPTPILTATIQSPLPTPGSPLPTPTSTVVSLIPTPTGAGDQGATLIIHQVQEESNMDLGTIGVVEIGTMVIGLTGLICYLATTPAKDDEPAVERIDSRGKVVVAICIGAPLMILHEVIAGGYMPPEAVDVVEAIVRVIAGVPSIPGLIAVAKSFTKKPSIPGMAARAYVTNK